MSSISSSETRARTSHARTVLSYGITVSATHVALRRRRSKFASFFVVPLLLFCSFLRGFLSSVLHRYLTSEFPYCNPRYFYAARISTPPVHNEWLCCSAAFERGVGPCFGNHAMRGINRGFQ
jgi:hypothetical protein